MVTIWLCPSVRGHPRILKPGLFPVLAVAWHWQLGREALWVTLAAIVTGNWVLLMAASRGLLCGSLVITNLPESWAFIDVTPPNPDSFSVCNTVSNPAPAHGWFTEASFRDPNNCLSSERDIPRDLSAHEVWYFLCPGPQSMAMWCSACLHVAAVPASFFLVCLSYSWSLVELQRDMRFFSTYEELSQATVFPAEKHKRAQRAQKSMRRGAHTWCELRV